ncbi:RlpA-like double-psi beta-barrel-protein domain-containing protein-containing protein [Bisporella sp. PMI_857]|nr:RlpA-like double-psi beta-barrel-protein domain-containing protein-containing protein [Bisporella sp. PMI_857]
MANHQLPEQATQQFPQSTLQDINHPSQVPAQAPQQDSQVFSQGPEWETRDGPHKKSKFPKLPFSNPFPHHEGPESAERKRHVWSLSKGFKFVPEDKEATPAAGQAATSRWQRKSTRIIVGVLFVFILALIIGLAVGLTEKGKSKSSAKNLPLPSNTATFTGDITYYSPGPGYGACGFENGDQDAICAVSHIVFDAAAIDSNPNHNPLCGKKIRLTRFDSSRGGNSSIDVTVVDRCVGCKATDIDLSIKMFTTLADEAVGRTTASWAWLN